MSAVRKSIYKLDIKGLSNIYVASSLQAPPAYVGIAHRHTFYEVVWLRSEEARFICDEEVYDLHAGAIVFISSGRVHLWQSEGMPLDLILIGFKASLLTLNHIDAQVLTTMPYFEAAALPYLQVQPEQQGFLGQLFEITLQRYRQLGVWQENYLEFPPAYEPMLLAYLNLILHEAQHAYPHQKTTRKVTAPMHLANQFLTQVELHYQNRLPIQTYADLLGISANYLTEVVRASTSSTPSEILNERLMLEAKRLLLYTHQSIAEISSALSFQNPSQFGQWFRRIEQVSPQTFRASRPIP